MTDTKKSILLAYLALGVGILTLGLSAIFVRWANAPGAVTSFYRMAVAAVILFLPYYRNVKTKDKLPREGVWMAVLGGFFFAADVASWATGVMLSGATNPTLLANTAPVWVGLGAMFFFREKLNFKFWAGLVVAIGGAALILGLDSLKGSALGLGSLYGLMAAIFYGGYFLFTQRGRETLDSLTYVWISVVSSTVVLLGLTLVLRQPLTGYSSFTYLNFLLAGLISQAMGYLAISYALGQLPASLVSPTMLGQPVVTAILAGPLLGEAISGLQIIGGVAVIVGVLVVHRSRNGE
jgi:drug/metabolite transporter (DMT)-like permease